MIPLTDKNNFLFNLLEPSAVEVSVSAPRPLVRSLLVLPPGTILIDIRASMCPNRVKVVASTDGIGMWTLDFFDALTPD